MSGYRVVGAESLAVEVVGVLGQGESGPRFVADEKEACAVVEQPRHLGGDVVEVAGRICDGQYVRRQTDATAATRPGLRVGRHHGAQQAHPARRPSHAVRAILDGAPDELCRGRAVHLHDLGVDAGQATALERCVPFGKLRPRLR